MEFNKFKIEGDIITLRTKMPLSSTLTKEFTEYKTEEFDGGILYKFEIFPNMSFSIRALLAKYKDIFSAEREVLVAIYEKTKFATMPIISLYSTGKHVQIQCPPIGYYLELIAAVGATNRGMNTYTVPIARAYDVIRAANTTPTFLPKFVVSRSLLEVIKDNLNGFDGSIASLFSTPIDQLKSVSNAYRVPVENFQNMGYKSVADFLVTQPRRYIDKTQITSYEDIEVKEPITLLGKIVDKKLVYYKHMQFKVEVGGTIFECMYYHRAWMEGKFSIGDEVLVMGEYAGNGKITGMSLESLVEAQALDIVPIYPQSAKYKITSKILLNVVYEAIERIKPHVHKLAPYIDEKEIPMSLGKAIKEMHFPTSSESYVGALETLALYELIYLQLMISDRQANEVKDKGIPKPYRPGGYYDAMVESLPWELTDAQKSGLKQFDKYMGSATSEQVLLTADVGSGKTIVGFLACMQALDNGYQSVFAAPTEVLAVQLHKNLVKSINDMPENKRPTVAFLGGKTKAKEKKEIMKYLKTGDIDILVGTHAVLNSSVEYRNLGLVVIDEQQKFGKAQREALLESRSDGLKPDILAQTATPIPRSTAQAFYGDIDLIQLNGKPKGRIEIVTKWIKENPKDVTKDKNNPMWKDIMNEIEKGHQVFVVVPMVYESAKMDSASVEGAYKDLKKLLPKARVGFTHGTLKKDEQYEAMENFRNRETDILIASTVIEVGVDVPNATRIVILSADRLGASSLHQIRGRVGRSNLESMCYLVSEGKTATSKRRLQALVDSTDGFEIAKIDLETRGEGDLFGARQAGDSSLRFSSLVNHSKLVGKAQEIAKTIYKSEFKEQALKDAFAILGKEEEVVIE